MFRILTCAVLFFTLSLNHQRTYAAQLAESPAVAVAPFIPIPKTHIPYLNIKSNNPYFNQYNNQYFAKYNSAGGPTVPILAYSSEHSPEGTYAFSFVTGDGKQVQENGFLKDVYVDNAGEPKGTQIVQGSFAYISPEGTPIQVNYVADENGFRPSGVHIPADGKISRLPFPEVGEKEQGREKSIVDRFYSRYNHRSHYGQYNANAYDSRYTYNTPTYNSFYNDHNQFPDVSQNRIFREQNYLQ